jgi:hypothetical protein
MKVKTLLCALVAALVACRENSSSSPAHDDKVHPAGTISPRPEHDPGAALELAAQHALAAAGPAEVVPIQVKKAEGKDGHTIAEIYAHRQALDNKNVAVRGQVVKFTSGVMKRNWIHLRDGTGELANRSHDLTVTTQASADVGDVVLVRGVVHLNRDIGAGYSYPVIVEDATLEK